MYQRGVDSTVVCSVVLDCIIIPLYMLTRQTPSISPKEIEQLKVIFIAGLVHLIALHCTGVCSFVVTQYKQPEKMMHHLSLTT